MLENLDDLIKTCHDYVRLKDDINFIFDAYSKPPRKYHTLEHVKFMLDLRDKSMISYTSTATPMSLGDQNLVYAIVLHDIRYEIGASPGVNEFYSAAYAYGRLQSEEVSEAIIATGFYLQDQNNLSMLAKELCDLDLANFTLPYDDFNYWGQLAIEESSLPLERAHRAQINFYTAMLSRKQIYYKHPEWEDLARENLKKRIASTQRG